MTIDDEYLNKILSDFREDNVYKATNIRFDNITPAQWRKRVEEARKLMYVKLNEAYNSIEKSLYRFDIHIGMW